jgi:hypothetical protein
MASIKLPECTREPVTVVLDTAFTPPLTGFRAAASGDVAIIDNLGTTRTIKSVLAGETVDVCCQQILTTGTTVTSPTTNITGLRG